jgi:DnaB-like helicase N terminal domain
VDHDLTFRTEQAALGAMIADPHMAARLKFLTPADFTDPRHDWAFRTVRLLSDMPHRPAGNWRDLIARTAGRWVTRKYLDGLVAACPDPAHGPAYGAMLVQAAVYRQVRGHADQINDQATLLGTESSRLSQARAPGARQAAELGTHLAEVARIIRGHTAMLAPVPEAAAGSRPGQVPAGSAAPAPATSAAQPEELVLAAVLQGHPQAGQILWFLPAAAFSDPARQEIFRAARRLHQSGRPVDELTVSWELSTAAAVTAFLAPGNTPMTQMSDGYIGKLASTDISGGEPPLRIAHDLDAQLRRKTYRHHPAAGQPGASQADGPGQLEAKPASAVVPLVQPAHPAGVRRGGPEQKR